MRRLGLIFLGLLLLSGGIGVLGWRIHNDPTIVERYERALKGEPAQTAKEAPADKLREEGTGGYITPGAPEGEAQRQPVGNLKLIEILLDLANVIVGLIGIGLAISGMRMRREASQA